MMKTWKLVSMLLLAFVAGACDDESAGEIDGGVGSAEQADVVWGYEAKTVLKNSGEVRVPLKLSRAVNSAVKITVEAEKRDVNTIAREGIDFNIPEKVVTIPAGDTIAFLKLDLLDDGKMTIDREIKLRMTGVYGGGKVGALSSASLYIVNNAFVEFEKAKWETWESADVETSSEVVRNSRFVPLVITGELTEAATIVLEVTDRSAIEPTHFTVEKEFRVSPGQTRIEVEVKPVDDSEINDDRIFILKIKEIRGGNLVLGKATPECEVKILSEEIQRNLFWEKTELNVEDKETVLDIPVVLDKVPLAAFTADVVVDAAGTDAVEGVDYEILTPQVSIDASRKATVQVKVLDNREINADRTLVLKFVNISDNTIWVKEEAKSFTLAIQNSDFPAFEGETLNAIEDELNQIRVSIPAVDRDRQIVLEYSTTEAVSGTYFETPQEIITIPAGANSVQIPLNVKYTVDFPTVAPEFTMSIVKVGDFVLENAINTSLVLTPCDYRKFLGTWKLSSDSPEAMNDCDIIVSAGKDGEGFNKNYLCHTEKGALCSNTNETLEWNMSYDKVTGQIKVIMGERMNVEELSNIYIAWYYYGNSTIKYIDTEWDGNDVLKWLSESNFVCLAFVEKEGDAYKGQQAGWHQGNVKMIRQ